MALDPSIIMQGGNINDPTKSLTLQDMALGIQQKRMELAQQNQQVQSQNALRNLFANPQTMDQNGNLTPQAMQQVMRIDPPTGIKLRETALTDQLKKAQTKAYQDDAQKAKFDAMTQVASTGIDAYDQAKASGASEDQARAMGIKARNEAAEMNGGILDDDSVKSVKAIPFDPVGVRVMAGLNKDYSTRKEKERGEIRQENGEQERERHDSAMEGAAGQREDRLAQALAGKPDASANKWQVLTDPEHEVDGKKVSAMQYRYNPETAQATTLDGKPYSPGGAARISGGGANTPASVALKKFIEENPDATADQISNFMQKSKSTRSPATAAISKYMEEHPNATSDDIEKENAKIRSMAKATQDFSTGKQGQAINSFNVGIAHLGTMQNLADALKNGNIQVFNKIGNEVASQTGKPAPTNFDTAKAIVGDEIIKAIIGGGGALADRENAQNQISSAKSPAQLAGVIKTYKELMAGQLNGLRQQYKTTTGLDDFEGKLLPETKAELENLKPTKAASDDHSKMSDDELKKKLGL